MYNTIVHKSFSKRKVLLLYFCIGCNRGHLHYLDPFDMIQRAGSWLALTRLSTLRGVTTDGEVESARRVEHDDNNDDADEYNDDEEDEDEENDGDKGGKKEEDGNEDKDQCILSDSKPQSRPSSVLSSFFSTSSDDIGGGRDGGSPGMKNRSAKVMNSKSILKQGIGGTRSFKKENPSLEKKRSIHGIQKKANGELRRKSSVLSIMRQNSIVFPSNNDADGSTVDTFVEDSDDRGWWDIHHMKKTLQVFLATNIMGIAYTRILVILSVLSAAELVVQSYFVYKSNLTAYESYLLNDIMRLELSLSIIFFFDWILSFFLADHKIMFVKSFYSMVDLFTCIPIIFTLHNSCPPYDTINTFYDIFLYFMYACNALRMLRCLRIRSYLLLIENEVLRQLGEMMLIFIVMVLFDAYLMQFLESHLDRPFDFNDWLYYTFVTLTTVGYGDIAPLSLLGRFAAMSYIFMAVTIVPSLTTALLAKMNATSVYARAKYETMINTNHIVICGDLNSTLLSEFFSELFHEGNRMLSQRVIFSYLYIINSYFCLVLYSSTTQIMIT